MFTNQDILLHTHLLLEYIYAGKIAEHTQMVECSMKSFILNYITWHHTIIRAAFVCVFVCFLSPPRSFGRSSSNLVGVCRWTSHLPLRGSFSKRSTGQRVNGSLSLSTILYMRQNPATQLQRRLLLCCYCCRV